MADVAAVFRTKPALNINYLALGIRSEGDSIPADLLGQSRFYSAKPQLGIYDCPLSQCKGTREKLEDMSPYYFSECLTEAYWV